MPSDAPSVDSGSSHAVTSNTVTSNTVSDYSGTTYGSGSSNPVSHTTSSHPSNNGDILPKLPDINDRALRTRIFTHKSLVAAPVNMGANNSEPDNNERLAFLGSHLVTQTVAAQLYGLQPRLNKGDLTRHLQEYVKVENIAVWSDWYHLTDHLRCHGASRMVLMHNTNTKAQLFHAYVGAVFDKNGATEVAGWIKVLVKYQEKHPAAAAPDYNDYTTSVADDETLAPGRTGGEHGALPSPPRSPRSEGTRTPTNDRPTPPSPGSPRFRQGVNPISRLNELYQQGKLSSPVEFKKHASGPSHAQTWSASVTVNWRTFTSAVHPKLQDAKVDVAWKAMDALNLS